MSLLKFMKPHKDQAARQEAISQDAVDSVLSWAEHPETKLLLEHLDAQADRPVDPGQNHQTLVMAVAKQNAFKDLRAKIEKRIESATARIRSKQ